MLRVVETFAGIGAQRQALENINIDFDIVATVEWDIAAILAYNIMHHMEPLPPEIQNMSKEELVNSLQDIVLSNNGKHPIKFFSLKRQKTNDLRLLYQVLMNANTPHFTDITKMNGQSLPQEIDLLTYSFPCQDLSIGSVFHNGDNNGIQKNGGTRSGLLWEIERILDERNNTNMNLPRFLLMENVSQVFSVSHREDFQKWFDKLASLGYYTCFSYEDKRKKWILNAKDFGIPQDRKRAFMLSIKICDVPNCLGRIQEILEEADIGRKCVRELKDINNFIFLNTHIHEAQMAHPNYTRSRRKIHGKIEETTKQYRSRGSRILVSYDSNLQQEIFTNEIANTITTKQDRNPCAGLIETRWGHDNGRPYRYLTPRECLGLMGFPDNKINNLLVNTNIQISSSKLYRLAGNSICVPVLEEIFKIVQIINEEIFENGAR